MNSDRGYSVPMRCAATCRRCLLAVLGLGLLLSAAAQAATSRVSAFLNRHQAQLGDTVSLTVRVTGVTDFNAPDTTALSADFDILGTDESTNFEISNGHSTSVSDWTAQLQPKHVGTITIPSLQVAGTHTAPLILTVTAAPTTSQGAATGGPVFIRLATDTLTPYVGQQINLTEQLFYRGNFAGGSISEPEGKDLQISRLGNNVRYDRQVGGRDYKVVEQRYAVTAQKAGKVELPALQFHGVMIVGGVSNGFGGFFGTNKPVEAHSQALEFDVRPRPAADSQGPWLPARQLTLALTGLPADGKAQVGEPLSLTLSEQASGLPSGALPEPNLPKLQGVEIYPDQSKDGTDDNNGEWLQGSRTRQFAVVPQQAGTLTIPEITLRWWNVEKDQAETASIPAHSLTVVAAAGASAAVPTPPESVAASGAGHGVPAVLPKGKPTGAAPQSSSIVLIPSDSRWRLLALVALGLWLLTMLVIAVWWWRRRGQTAQPRRAPASKPASGVQLKSAFLQTVRNGDINAQAEALLAWGRSERSSLHTLGELSLALASTAQRDAIAELQRARYAASAVAQEDNDALAEVFAKGFDWKSAAAQRSAPLPPLYPD